MRRVAAVLAAAAIGIGGGGCAAPANDASAYEDTPCPVPNLPGYPMLDLGSEFRCGFLTVPEDRADPDGRTIKVAVARVRPANPDASPDPLVYLTGGPGGTAIVSAVALVAQGFNSDREVLFVDQRGTYHSDPALTCPEIDDFTAAAVGMSLQAETTARDDLDAVTACHTRFVDAGWNLAAYNTAENAADLADLRRALHIDEWNVYGISYGSDLALQLLRDHPEGIRSVVLDSVVPPQTNLMNQFWPSAAEGFAALFDACAAQPACARAYPNLADELTTTVQRLAAAPLSVDLPAADGQPARRVVIDGYTVASSLVQLSTAAGSYAQMPKAIHGLATGDGQDMARLVASLPAPPGLIGYGLTYGAFCREHAAFTDTATVVARAREALPEWPDEVLSLLPQAPRLLAECPIWDVGRADVAVHEPTRSDVPVLLMTGTLDAITPPSQADLAATTLTNSRVVRFPGYGHGVTGAECAQQVMLDFLNSPTGYGFSCAQAMQVPAFDT